MINNPLHSSTLQGLTGAEYTQAIFRVFVNLCFAAGAIVFLFMFLTGSIAWITAGDDRGKYENAKNRVSKAVLGLVVLLFAYTIINFVGCILGFSLLSFSLGELNVQFNGSPLCR